MLVYVAKSINFDAAKVPLIERALKCNISVVLAVYESGLLVILYRYKQHHIRLLRYFFSGVGILKDTTHTLSLYCKPKAVKSENHKNGDNVSVNLVNQPYHTRLSIESIDIIPV